MKKAFKKNTKYFYFALALLIVFWIGILFWVDAGKTLVLGSASLSETSDTDISLDSSTSSHFHPVAEASSEKNSYDDFLIQNTSELDLGLFASLGEKISYLEKRYALDSDEKTFSLLLDAYVLNRQYHDAKMLIYKLSSQDQQALDKKLLFTIILQSFSQTTVRDYELVTLLAKKLYDDQEISSSEYAYYRLLFAITESDTSTIQDMISQLSGSKYTAFIKKVEQNYESLSNFEKAPSYYLDGLMAHTLMEEGYFALAKKKALSLAIQYPDYILPYQVLAYANFSTHDYARSVEYFSKLLELDYESKANYLYYLGVAHYYVGEFTEAVVYLSQITDPHYLLDADRFLVLSYIKLGDRSKILYNWKRLFNHKNIKESDFYTFFQEAFWNFYRLGTSSWYLTEDPDLVKNFLNTCKNYLSPNSESICLYGALGYAAMEGKQGKIDAHQLEQLAQKYEQSELYQFLGDVYLEQKKKDLAIPAFMKALKLTSSAQEKNVIKTKILKTSELDL